MEVLSRDHDIYVRGWVAQNPYCPAGLLESLAITSRDEVLVAGDAQTSDVVLASLVDSGTAAVREALANRPFLPALPVLSTDEEVSVREEVAKQRATPVDVLRVLAGDPQVSVRKAVHRNKAATDEVRAIAALLGVE